MTVRARGGPQVFGWLSTTGRRTTRPGRVRHRRPEPRERMTDCPPMHGGKALTPATSSPEPQRRPGSWALVLREESGPAQRDDAPHLQLTPTAGHPAPAMTAAPREELWPAAHREGLTLDLADEGVDAAPRR